MKDLFGEVPKEQEVVNAKRRSTTPAGYAGIPGTGPAGETCRGCFWYRRLGHRQNIRKCGHQDIKPRWTHGIKTDIKASAPACSKFVEAMRRG